MSRYNFRTVRTIWCARPWKIDCSSQCSVKSTCYHQI